MYVLIIYVFVPFIILLGCKFLEMRSSAVYLYALHRVNAPEYWLNIVTLNSHSHNLLFSGANKRLGLDSKKLPETLCRDQTIVF